MRMRWNGGQDAARVAALRRRVERWRWTRVKRTRMPEGLWAQASELAQRHGAYQIARALGVGYQGLKDRLGQSAGAGGAAARRPPEFVEIAGSALLGSAAQDVIEVSDPSGRRLVIRLSGAVDVAAVLAAFVGPPP